MLTTAQVSLPTRLRSLLNGKVTQIRTTAIGCSRQQISFDHALHVPAPRNLRRSVPTRDHRTVRARPSRCGRGQCAVASGRGITGQTGRADCADGAIELEDERIAPVRGERGGDHEGVVPVTARLSLHLLQLAIARVLVLAPAQDPRSVADAAVGGVGRMSPRRPARDGARTHSISRSVCQRLGSPWSALSGLIRLQRLDERALLGGAQAPRSARRCAARPRGHRDPG